MVKLPWRRKSVVDEAPEDFNEFLKWLGSRFKSDVMVYILNTIAAAAEAFRDEVEECVRMSRCGRKGAVVFACAARAAHRRGLINAPVPGRLSPREAARMIREARMLERMLNEVAKKCYEGAG